MSAVLVLTPVIIANWATITVFVAAAAKSLDFVEVPQANVSSRVDETTSEELDVDNSEILANTAGRDEELVVEREGLRAVFTRDGRGALRVCMEGRGYSKADLRKVGQELVDRVTQQYVYHRLMTEMKQRNMHVVSEEVAEDRTVKIRVRNW